MAEEPKRQLRRASLTDEGVGQSVWIPSPEEAATRKRMEELQSIVDATPALIAYIGQDFRYRFVNLQYALWFGHPQDELIGRHVSEVLGDQAFQHLQPFLARALSGEEVQFESEVPYRDGGDRFVKVSYRPDRGHDGEVRGIHVLVVDIRDRKLAEDALRQTETRLHMAMEAGQMGTWEWSLESGEVTWSPTLEAIHGLAPGTFGGTFADVQREMHPEDRPRVLAAIQESVEKRTDYRIEYRIVKPDGAVIWIEASGKLLLDADGNPEGMAGICMDVTARLQAEEALRVSERFNRTLIESSRDCIKTLNLDGVILWINRIGWESVGASGPSEVVGRSWLDSWEGDNRRLAEAALRTAAEGGTGTFIGRTKRDGPASWWDVAATPILDPAGRAERILVVARDATERIKLEEARARLAAVVEFSEDAIITKNLDGIVATWNQGAERMFGYLAEEIVGKPVKLLIPPQCADDATSILERLRQGEVVQSYESVRRHKNGTLLHVSLTISPIKDASGNIIGASKIARDITLRKEADAERARLASVLEKSLNEIYIFDTEQHRFQYVNEGALRNLGYSMDEMHGMTPLDLMPDIVEEEFHAMVEPLFRHEQENLIFYTWHRRAPGSLYPVEVHLQCVEHLGLEVFLAVVLDITERRKAEQERERLLASEQRERAKAEEAETRSRFLAHASARLASSLDYESTLAQVAEAAVPDIADWCAVHLLAPDGGIRAVATAHFDPAKLALAKELQERFPPDPDANFGLAAVLRFGQPLLYPEISDDTLSAGASSAEHLELLRSLGLKSAVIVPLIANGKTLGAITLVESESGRHFNEDDLPFAEDLAARAAVAAENARLYRELRHANAAKDRFLAVLSHELRTPLNPVLMTVTDLERDESMPEDLREQMTLVRRNIELEARLIDDLLDSTRIANGKLQLQCSVVDIRELLRRALAIVEADARNKGLNICLTTCEALCPVDGDPARLQQVFWNVVKNAVKFTPEGGSIFIDCVITASNFARISVRDSGVGIAPEHIGRIFNAFEQGDSNTTHRFGGLGLGLAISQALVALHHGTLSVESEGIGHGATFTIDLPLTAAIRPPVAESLPPPALNRALHLLVVEDHDATAEVMARLLRKRGYTVTMAPDVTSALEAAEKAPIDILISDLGLPDGSGRELMGRIRECYGIPGIALSGYGTDEDAHNSREAGFSAHLNKPVDVERLDREIQRLTARP